MTYATGFGYRVILREQVWTMTKSSLSVPWIYYQVLLRDLAAVLRAWYGSLYIIVCFNCPVKISSFLSERLPTLKYMVNLQTHPLDKFCLMWAVFLRGWVDSPIWFPLDDYALWVVFIVLITKLSLHRCLEVIYGTFYSSAVLMKLLMCARVLWLSWVTLWRYYITQSTVHSGTCTWNTRMPYNSPHQLFCIDNLFSLTWIWCVILSRLVQCTCNPD